MPVFLHKDAQRAALMHEKKDNYMDGPTPRNAESETELLQLRPASFVPGVPFNSTRNQTCTNIHTHMHTRTSRR